MLSSKPKQKGRSATTPSTRHTSREAMSKESIDILAVKRKYDDVADDIKNSPCWTLATENGDPYNKYLRWPLRDGDKGDLHTFDIALKLLEKHRNKDKAKKGEPSVYLRDIVCLKDGVTTTDTQPVKLCADTRTQLQKDVRDRLLQVRDKGQEGTNEGQSPDSSEPDADWKAESLKPKEGTDKEQARTNEGQSPKSPEPDADDKLLTTEELYARPPMEWMVDGVIPTTGIGQVYGESRAGKSFLLIPLAACVSRGRRWYGRETRPTPVTFILLEGREGFGSRIQGFEQYHECKMSENVTYYVKDFSLTNENDIDKMAKMLPKNCLVIIDTQSKASVGVDSNDTKSMGKLAHRAEQLAKAVNGFVLLVAHTGKDVSRGVLGSSVQIAACDLQIEVKRTKSNSTWKVVKNKEGVEGLEHAFKLESVTLPTRNALGSFRSTCVALPVEKDTLREKSLEEQLEALPDGDKAVLQALHGVLQEKTEIQEKVWREHFYNVPSDQNQDAKKAAFGRARTKLVEMGYITKSNDIITLISKENMEQ